MSDIAAPIVVGQIDGVPRDELWRAITQHDRMTDWFFDNLPEFEVREGFSSRFVVDTGERQLTHLWTITEVVPPEKFVYDWRYKGHWGIGKVTFELSADGPGSRLRLINEGLESFSREVPGI